MSSNLSQEAFCSLLVRSGLISDERLAALRAEYQQQRPATPSESSRDLTEFLIRRNELTRWQAEKLLQRKHKGFLLGKYKLLSLLGRGGMSCVYLAEHREMRRRCAIKVLPFQQVDNPAAFDRFYREARAVAALDDPHIVRAYDVDHVTEGDTEIHFLVMEYVPGRSLQQVVDEVGPLPIVEAVEYVRQAASGLAHAHAAGMVHRDVKPSNLLLDEAGTIKLLDLGLARMFENASEQSSVTLEHQQSILGTADFLAPEQAIDSHSADHRADIYSLGCTLYFLLSGRPPFPDGSLAQRLLAHQSKDPEPIADSRSDVPETLAWLIDRMMAKQPCDRFPTAEALAQVLSAWLTDNAGELTPSASTHQEAAPETGGVGAVDDAKNGGTRRATARQVERVDDSEISLRSFLRSLDSSNDHETLVPALSTAETVVTDPRPRLSQTSGRKPRTAVSYKSEPHAASESNSSFVLDQPAIDVPRSPRTSASWKSSGIWMHVWQGRSPSAVFLRAVASSLLACLVFGAFLWWTQREPLRRSSPVVSASRLESPETEAAGSVIERGRTPQIAPEGDITVGPDGRFSTISAALEHVRDSFGPRHPRDVRTIRVAGGRTYDERIAIDNSQFSTFPKGVRVICEDAQPAVLQPIGSAPIIDLTTVERFQLRGFTIRGSGQPTLVRLAGYMVSTQLSHLTIEGVQVTGLRGVGVTGFSGQNRLILRDITIRDPRGRSVAMQFRSGRTQTKDLLIRRCRILDDFASGIEFTGDTAGVDIAECIFDGPASGIGFQASPGVWEDIAVSNCTFRRFDRGLRFDRPPTPSDGSFRFVKNLFVGVGGPEFVLAGATDEMSPRHFTSSFNWTEGAAASESTAEEFDLFQNHGRRGAAITFVSTDPAARSTFLQPSDRELREASAGTPRPPKYIGAVPPAAE